jgi:hypothetical protein
MKPKKIIPFSVTTAILLIFLLNGVTTMAIEEAEYDVLESAGDFELRNYHPHIVAETFVKGDFDEAGNEGFRRLFAYISGENRKKMSVSMTAPVSQEKTYEKIAMTAPVNQQKEEGLWRVTFMMPSQYTLETLPEPLDEKVKLKKTENRLMAALIYSGTWSKKRFEKKKERLKSLIRERELVAAGEPVFARYNPPFMPWFFRRNEVLIAVHNTLK